MKLKNIMSAFLIVLLIISSLTFTAFAADDRQNIVVYPGFNAEKRAVANGDKTPAGGGYFSPMNYSSDTAATNGYPETDGIERNPGTLQSTNTSGWTNLKPATIKQHSGFSYKPCASDATGTSGWYEVYLERLLYRDMSATVVPNIMHVIVTHAGGTSSYVMNLQPSDDYTTKTKFADQVYVGTFFFNNAENHEVRLFIPVLRNESSTAVMRFDYGGAKFVPVDGPESAKGYYNPVYGDTLADGINTTWYQTTGTAAYDFDTATVKIPANSSLKIKYDANDDAKDAVAFTEGAIRFDMVWRNTTHNDASTSVIISKGNAKNAEFKIYSEKVEYLENGTLVKEIPICGSYAFYYNYTSSEGKKHAWYPSQLSGVDERIHTMRLEISDPELLSTTDETEIVNNEKTVKLIINDGTNYAHVMAMGTLPANSILNTANSDLTDNYIEFKNNGGTTDKADINISNIGVMVPDESLKSDNIYSTSYNELKYTDFKDEFDVDAGVITVEADVAKPMEITNTLLNSNPNPGIAIFAPFAASGKLADAPEIRSLQMLPGTKKNVRFVFDSKPYLKTTLKFFIWDSLDSLVPAQPMEREYID